MTHHIAKLYTIVFSYCIGCYLRKLKQFFFLQIYKMRRNLIMKIIRELVASASSLTDVTC